MIRLKMNSVQNGVIQQSISLPREHVYHRTTWQITWKTNHLYYDFIQLLTTLQNEQSSIIKTSNITSLIINDQHQSIHQMSVVWNEDRQLLTLSSSYDKYIFRSKNIVKNAHHVQSSVWSSSEYRWFYHQWLSFKIDAFHHSLLLPTIISRWSLKQTMHSNWTSLTTVVFLFSICCQCREISSGWKCRWCMKWRMMIMIVFK